MTIVAPAVSFETYMEQVLAECQQRGVSYDDLTTIYDFRSTFDDHIEAKEAVGDAIEWVTDGLAK